MGFALETTSPDTFPRTTKMVIFGRPGAGKTALIKQYPNPLIIASEVNLMSIAGADIPFVRVNTKETLDDVVRPLIAPAASREKSFGRPIDTVVVDTIDTLQSKLFKEHVKGKTKEFKHWDWIGELMEDLMNKLTSVPDLNVVLNCHIKEVTSKDPKTDEEYTTYRPDLKGNFAGKISGFVDLAMLLEERQEKVVTPAGVTKRQNRYLIAHKDEKYPFLKDGTPATYPAEMPINFKDDYERILGFAFKAAEDMARQRKAETQKVVATNEAAAQYSQNPEKPTNPNPTQNTNTNTTKKDS